MPPILCTRCGNKDSDEWRKVYDGQRGWWWECKACGARVPIG